LSCFSQVSLQACVLTTQLRDLLGACIARRSTRRSAQRLQRTLVALLAPLGDQRRVQALASEESASTIAIPPFVFGQNPQLVLRAIGPTRRALGHLGLRRLSHRFSMPAGYHTCHHHRDRDPQALRLSDFEFRSASPNVDTEGGAAALLLGQMSVA